MINLNRLRVSGALMFAGAIFAADTPVIPSGGGEGHVDPVTARRAEKAAQEYLDHQAANQTPIPAETVEALADAEVLLLEASTFLDQGNREQAGDRYVAAGSKLNKIAPDQRSRLGERYRSASERLLAITRRLLLDAPAIDGATTPSPAR